MYTAAGSLSSTPDLRLELADGGAHFAAVYTGASTGPCAACLAPDGSLVVAYVAGATVKATRIPDPSVAAQWTAGYTTVSADGRESAGVALCDNGVTVRLLFQQGSSTDIRYCDSLDNGVSWSAPASLFALGKTCYGIGFVDVNFSTVFVAYDNTGGGTVRLAVWRFGGVWAGVDWTNGDLNTLTGIAVAKDGLGNYGVVLAGQGVAGQPYSILSAVYNAGHVWSGVQAVRGVDLALGILLRYPHLTTSANGVYRLTYQEQDNGSSDGLVYVRVSRMSSADFVHWTAPIASPQAGIGHGAVWTTHALGDVLASADAALFSPAYNPGSMYRDVSSDIIRLELAEQQSQPARLTVVLDNSTGIYTNLPALKHHAQLQLSQGYVGVGLVATHLLYVDNWTFGRAADVNEVTIVASDQSRYLALEAQYPVSYANRALSYLAPDLATYSGALAPMADDGAAVWSSNVSAYQLASGRTVGSALLRLLSAFDCDYLIRLQAVAGVAFANSEAWSFVNASPSQPAIWTYNLEPESYDVESNGERANHIVVRGPVTVPTAVAEVFDTAELTIADRERFALIIEPLAVTAALAVTVAAVMLNREKRLGTRVTLTVGPNPALELLDAVTINDAVLPALTVRIVAAQLVVLPAQAEWSLALVCEGL